MDLSALRKPEKMSESAWRQHLRWMQVMDGQVEENLRRHRARAATSAQRGETPQTPYRADRHAAREIRGASLFNRVTAANR